MKVGMIFECADEGPDIKVCAHLAKRIRPDITVVPDALGNKRYMLVECGESAAALLADGCEKVLIIWDLYPSFKRNEDPCLHRDRDLIFESLAEADVDLGRVELICIEAELETWLVAEYRAVRDVIRKWSPKANIGRLKKMTQANDPKVQLERLFENHIGRPYLPYRDAELIVQAIPDLRRLRRVPSFRRFETKLTT
ncbi:MAG: hypothetical protein OXE52_20725 [Chloroflexi bacterium]|nr:hypothetical protein [Chloroflexota bacterium]